jgi:predicted O-methyltransferase YrrM
MARATFARSGQQRITLVHGDAGQWLAQAADASIDLLFLDSDREQYAGWWPQLRRVLRPGGLLVVDNALRMPTDGTAGAAGR